MKKVVSTQLFPPFFLIVIILVRYYSIVNSFWLADDTQILKHALSYHPWEYFFFPKVWQEFSANNFSPWVIFSFDIDWKIFGLHPYGFYLHQLIGVCLLAVIAYAVLRLWFSCTLSFLGVLLFTISPPFAEVTQFLMMRHYIEGMIFAFLCIYFFVNAIRHENIRSGVVAAFFYLLSCSAKEIYLPLIGLLLLLPESTFRRRLYMCLPCLGIAVFYIIWRWFMLGRLLGGYGLELTWPQDAKLFFPRIADAMGGSVGGRPMVWWPWLIGGSSLFASALLFYTDKKTLFYILAASPLLLLPLVPVSPVMSTRYVWLLSFCWVIVHIISWDKLTLSVDPFYARSGILLWGSVLMVAFFQISSYNTQVNRELINRQTTEGRFVLREGTRTDLLIDPGAAGWYYSGISWLREKILHLSEGPSISYEPQIVCMEMRSDAKKDSPFRSFKTVWNFDSKQGILRSENIKDFCGREIKQDIRKDCPLNLKVNYRNSTFSWEFGPYKSGDYALLFGSTIESAYPLSVTGERFVSLKDNEPIQLRLRYISTDGWRTYSPLLNLKVAGGYGNLQWQR